MRKVERIPIQCNYCGKTFYVLPCESYRKFCSNKCSTSSGPHRKDKIAKTCLNCGKTFYVRPGESHRKFCSKKCVSVSVLTPIITKTCEHCNQSFTIYPHEQARRFCSRHCANSTPRTVTKPRTKHSIAKTCLACGNTFYVARHESGCKFCSRKCFRKYHSVPTTTRYCEYCGNAFPIDCSNKEQRFCSPRCATDSNNSSEERLCIQCGTAFRASRKSPQRFCSRKCWQDYCVHTPRECPICHTTFIPSTLTQRYCSPPCQHQCRRESVTKVCSNCGKEFQVPQNLIQRKKYCSRHCQFAHKSSQDEKRAIAIVEDILQEQSSKQHGFSWLISDLRRPMLLDAYFPTTNLAVEYDGRHHREYNPLYHKTYDQFIRSQQLDKMKDELLAIHGIPLLRISDNEQLTIEHLASRVSELLS